MALQLLDVEKFLQQKKAKAVTNPRIFDSNMEFASGGLQDPAIFGVSPQERFDNWGYIDLKDVIMHPLIHENLGSISPILKRILDKKIKAEVVNGEVVESDTGGNGLGWLISNWGKINFDKFRTEKNKLYIDLINKLQNNLIFIKKVPVIPINYREAHKGTFKLEPSEIDDLYVKIMNLSSSGSNDFTSAWLESIKEASNKEILQNSVNALYNYFLDKIEGKSGFIRGTLLAKRLDNVARMVANARPDIPIDSCVIPWHILLNMFDIFIVGYLKSDDSEELRKKLGVDGFMLEDYGNLFDFIYRNAETYDNHYPGRRKLWIKVLEDIFNENPHMRVLLKRDPGWNADSFWCFKPLINDENSYQVWVSSFVYAPLGGDSVSTNFFILSQKTNIIYEDENYQITTKNPNTRIVKTIHSVWKHARED